MMKIPRLAIAAVLGLGAFCGTDAVAAPCRDLHGQFVACPPPKPPQRCVDIKTKHPAKCGTPATESIQSGIRRFNG